MNMKLPAPAANKVAEISLAFWIMKICATTLGETAGDLLSMTMQVGYALSSVILLGCFFVSLVAQLRVQRFHPALYWLVILTTSTAGTTMSDYLDRSLGLGYAQGSLLLIIGLCAVLATWRITEGNLSVSHISRRRVEVFYWLAVLLSNTLGTALGDFLADDSGLGFLGGACLIAGLIAGVVVLHKLSAVSRVVLFWLAFVLTRPLGATLGDLLTKSADRGGLDFGTLGSSAVLLAVLVALLSITRARDVQRVVGCPGSAAARNAS